MLFPALIQVLDDQPAVTIGTTEHAIHGGEAILLPADIGHAVRVPSPPAGGS